MLVYSLSVSLYAFISHFLYIVFIYASSPHLFYRFSWSFFIISRLLFSFSVSYSSPLISFFHFHLLLLLPLLYIYVLSPFKIYFTISTFTSISTFIFTSISTFISIPFSATSALHSHANKRRNDNNTDNTRVNTKEMKRVIILQCLLGLSSSSAETAGGRWRGMADARGKEGKREEGKRRKEGLRRDSV